MQIHFSPVMHHKIEFLNPSQSVPAAVHRNLSKCLLTLIFCQPYRVCKIQRSQPFGLPKNVMALRVALQLTPVLQAAKTFDSCYTILQPLNIKKAKLLASLNFLYQDIYALSFQCTITMLFLEIIKIKLKAAVNSHTIKM